MSLPLGSDPPASARNLIDRVADCLSDRGNTTVWVALSGGLDSTLLLACAAQLGVPVTALHIHHGLHRDADAWEYHCAELAGHFNVSFRSQRVTIEPGSNLEARARDARYGVFKRCLEPGGCLLLGHHLNDNVEQFLFRLVRGSSADELTGMPARRALGNGLLLRPWLAQARAELEQVARDWGLSWIEDPSNQSLVHDRNFLRHEILPRLLERWPSALTGLERSREAIAGAQSLSGKQADRQISGSIGPHGELPLALIHDVPRAQGLTRLKRWLAVTGLRPVSGDQLRSLFEQTSRQPVSGHFAVPVIGPDGRQWIRHFDGALYKVPEWLAVPAPMVETEVDAGRSLDIPGIGRVRLSHAPSAPRSLAGLNCSPIPVSRARLSGARLTIAPAQPGQRAHPVERARSRDLKRLYQELGIPPWWRQRVPFLRADGQAVAAAGLWAEQGWAESPEDGDCVFLEWLPGP